MNMIVDRDLKGNNAASQHVAGQKIGKSPASKASTRTPGKPKGSTQTTPSKKKDVVDDHNLLFGVVVSFKDTFGFIQPLTTDEDIYFSARDAPHGIKLGEEVMFYQQMTPKGVAATNLQLLNHEQIVNRGGITGVVVREAETHRAPFGSIEVNSVTGENLPKYVTFLYEDQLDSSKKLKKGDTVSFTLQTIEGTCYSRGKDVHMILSKREKVIQEQIQAILEGKQNDAIQQGHIDTIHNDYGFIRSADRSDTQYYFRLDDIIDKSIKPKPDLDVEFLVVQESGKGGKFNDRAVYIRILPPGSVQLETVLVEGVLGTVIDEPLHQQVEHPGFLRLHSPLVIPGKPPLEIIEIWSRCCPDGLQCRVGDEYIVDVTHYRPENLYFARNITIKSFRLIGREYGKISRLNQGGFGFLYSSMRDMDVYFRTNELIGFDGHHCKGNALQTDLLVSYDVVMEDIGRGGGPHNNGGRHSLRAIRVRIEESASSSTENVNEEGSNSNNNSNSKPNSHVSESALANNSSEENVDYRFLLKKKSVFGIVLREPKKDVPGQIRPLHDMSDLIPSDEDLSSDIMEGVKQFLALDKLQEVCIESLVPSQRRLYYYVLDKLNNVAYETMGSTDAKARSLKIWKVNENQYNVWKSSKTLNASTNMEVKPNSSSAQMEGQGNSSGSNTSNNNNGNNGTNQCIYFMKSDVNNDLGVVTKDRQVKFNAFWDRRTGRVVGKAVSLTDSPGDNDDNGKEIGVGVVDLQRNGKVGFVRVLPTDEQLALNIEGGRSTLADGTEVSFEVRVRGGVRCALNVEPLPKNSLRKEQVLEGACTAVVVDVLHVVLADVTGCPDLAGKYADLIKAVNSKVGMTIKPWTHVSVNQSKQSNNSNSSVQSQQGSSETKTTAIPISSSSDTQEKPTIEKKFYGSLVRAPVAMDCPANVRDKLIVGELVYCRVVVNWALQRYPIRVCDIKPFSPDNSYALQNRHRGTVTKVKLPMMLGQNVNGEHLFLHQIMEGPSDSSGASSGGDTCHYFLDSREGLGLNGVELKRGDVVQFFAIPNTKVAVGATYLGNGPTALATPITPPLSTTSSTNATENGNSGSSSSNSASHVSGKDLSLREECGIVFKRTPVNAELKKFQEKGQAAGGVRAVTMAKGPPDPNSPGFEAGWREQPDVSGLAWGHLLRL